MDNDNQIKHLHAVFANFVPANWRRFRMFYSNTSRTTHNNIYKILLYFSFSLAAIQYIIINKCNLIKNLLPDFWVKEG